MLKNHFKIALRFFKKNRLFTGINIAGLSIGIAAFLILTQYVSFEKSYDKDIEEVYRVTLSSNLSSDMYEASATNHPAVGPALHSEFPEVIDFARLIDAKVLNTRGVLSYQQANGEVQRFSMNDFKSYFADNSFLDLFDIPLVLGDRATALEKPETILISRKTANQFFGDEDPIGKEIIVNSEGGAIVTGVFENLPQNTHLDFDVLISFSTLGKDINTIWNWPEFYNYIKLNANTDLTTVAAKFPAFVDKHMSDMMKEYGFDANFELQPVSNIHLSTGYKKEMSVGSNTILLNFLMIIALLVIGIAFINFINMSTAKSLERAKEVGIKKVVGVDRKMLIFQFLTESTLLNFFALVMAIFVVLIVMEPFNKLVEVHVLTPEMWSQPSIWFSLIGLVLIGGLLAGLYPAFVLSDFKPVEVLKGKFHHSGKGNLLRKGLIIGQFIISIALISGTYILYQQFLFMKNQDLGFDAEQNIVINAPVDWNNDGAYDPLERIETFKEDLRKIPHVNNITQSSDIPGKAFTSTDGVRRSGDDRAMIKSMGFMAVDHDFINTYRIPMLAGRGFTKEDKSDYFPDDQQYDVHSHRVIINASTVKALGFTDPETALHQKVVFKYGPAERTAEIIGVMKDYHQQSLQAGITNTLFIYDDRYLANHITVNVAPENLEQTIASIKSKYSTFFPKDPFDYFFLDAYFNQQYHADLKAGLILLLFSVLAIFIAAIGLFGMGWHMAMQKLKEISIRKVLGANTLQALLLIPKHLLILVGVAGLIAFPLIYFFANEWLKNYAYRIELSIWMFVLPFVMVLFVAIAAISIQSIKGAYVNPVHSLRDN